MRSGHTSAELTTRPTLRDQRTLLAMQQPTTTCDNKKMHPSGEVGRFQNGQSFVATG